MRLAPAGEAVLLAALTVACLVPFLGKPFHLDDPLFFWAARQIAAHPLDPYGFSVNWYLAAEPMATVTKNPPGAAYFLAVAGALLGWSPVALHAAFLLPATAVVVGTWALARRLSARPLLAGLLVLASPGFLVSATTLMSDVTMLALWMTATVLWLDGVERDRVGLMAAAAVVCGACVLTKYPGAGVVPLLAAYAALRRGWGRWIAVLAIPVVMIVAYEWWSATSYGQAHLSDSLGYASREREGASLHGVLVSLAFMGGTALAALPVLLGVGQRSVVAAAVAVGGAAAGALLGWGRTWWPNAPYAEGWGWIGLHFGVFVAAGAGMLALAGADAWRRRDAASALLGCWMLGIAVFAGFVNWMVNVRSVLPIVPAAALLAARAADDRWRDRPLPTALMAGVLACVVVGLWVAWGDAALARSQVRAAETIATGRAGREGTLWFQGHWGFQLAMEARGGRPVDVNTTRFLPGDAIVLPRNNTNVVPLPEAMPVRRERLDVAVGMGGTTVSGRRGSGFYSSVWGPLPYRLDPPPRDPYDVYEVLPTPE